MRVLRESAPFRFSRLIESGYKSFSPFHSQNTLLASCEPQISTPHELRLQPEAFSAEESLERWFFSRSSVRSFDAFTSLSLCWKNPLDDKEKKKSFTNQEKNFFLAFSS